jgi:hypothetical protein
VAELSVSIKIMGSKQAPHLAKLALHEHDGEGELS